MKECNGSVEYYENSLEDSKLISDTKKVEELEAEVETLTPKLDDYCSGDEARILEEVRKYTQCVHYSEQDSADHSLELLTEVVKLLKIRYDEDGEETSGEDGETAGFRHVIRTINDIGKRF